MDRKVAIVTDSVNCIPEEMLTRYNIREVPIKVLFGETVYRDREDLKPADFYRMLKEAQQLPTTAAPSPEDFLDVFTELSRETSGILCITMSGKLSGTFNAALAAMELARETLPDTVIEVLDSGVAASSEGFVVLAAARAAADGKNLAEAANAARCVMEKVYLLAILDTLKYLAKGGRAPRVIAWAGNLLDIKPILAIKEGEAHLAGQARTYLHAIRHMLDMTKAKIVDGLPLHMAIMHANEPQRAEELKNMITSSFDCAELLVCEFTPVMGVHTGPGLIGVAFYCGD